MTYHKKAARLIRDAAAQLEMLAARVQVQLADNYSCAQTEELEERRDGIEEAICDLLNAAENLELIP